MLLLKAAQISSGVFLSSSVVFCGFGGGGGDGGGEGPVGYLSVPRRRGPSWGAVMSAGEGAVEEVQELRGRGDGVGGGGVVVGGGGGGGGGGSDLW